MLVAHVITADAKVRECIARLVCRAQDSTTTMPDPCGCKGAGEDSGMGQQILLVVASVPLQREATRVVLTPTSRCNKPNDGRETCEFYYCEF